MAGISTGLCEYRPWLGGYMNCCHNSWYVGLMGMDPMERALLAAIIYPCRLGPYADL